jgi:hypothetical protein
MYISKLYKIKLFIPQYHVRISTSHRLLLYLCVFILIYYYFYYIYLYIYTHTILLINSLGPSTT